MFIAIWQNWDIAYNEYVFYLFIYVIVYNICLKIHTFKKEK